LRISYPPQRFKATTRGILFINEVLSNAKSVWNCAKTATDPDNNWVEFYNSQDQPIDMYANRALLIDKTNGSVYYPGQATIIPAKGFLVAFLPTNFFPSTNISIEMQLFLNDVLIDDAALPPLHPDNSYARIPDGSNNWQTTVTPTIDASNVLPATMTPTARPTKAGTTIDTPSAKARGILPSSIRLAHHHC
jgi:hypothetical protein